MSILKRKSLLHKKRRQTPVEKLGRQGVWCMRYLLLMCMPRKKQKLKKIPSFLKVFLIPPLRKEAIKMKVVLGNAQAEGARSGLGKIARKINLNQVKIKPLFFNQSEGYSSSMDLINFSNSADCVFLEYFAITSSFGL